MSKLEQIANGISILSSSIASLLKAAILSKRLGIEDCILKQSDDISKELVILGNGPSLRDTITCHEQWLKSHIKLAVNFAANSAEYSMLKPEYYVLADSHFFEGINSDENVAKLWANLRAADWNTTLFVPATCKKQAISLLKGNNKISIRCFNLTPIEGFRKLRHLAFRKGWGMPRPRNVLIPSLMVAIAERFNTIYLAGADHTWIQTLSVDNENHVVSIQPHFYEDSDKEKHRVSTEYKGYHLHDILNSMAIAFSSYFTIREYAESVKSKIINITPGSYIDAFDRGEPGY